MENFWMLYGRAAAPAGSHRCFCRRAEGAGDGRDARREPRRAGRAGEVRCLPDQAGRGEDLGRRRRVRRGGGSSVLERRCKRQRFVSHWANSLYIPYFGKYVYLFHILHLYALHTLLRLLRKTARTGKTDVLIPAQNQRWSTGMPASQLEPARRLFAGPFEKKGGKYIPPPKF